MAYIDMACTGVAYTGMAYIVAAYIVTALIEHSPSHLCTLRSSRSRDEHPEAARRSLLHHNLLISDATLIVYRPS